jgi:elongation factor P
MYETSDFRIGLKLEYNGDPYVIVDFQHVKPGKGNQFSRTKIKNLKSGAVLEFNFRSGEKFPKPDLEEKEMQYLYREGEQYHFMDSQTYEQTFLNASQFGGLEQFMPENTTVYVVFYNGEPLSIDLPNQVEVEIVETDPGFKGDTATGGSKPAKISTGATIQVPFHINQGDIVRVDTRTRQFIQRVSTG